MAEGFARKYGADVMVPASAGVAPAMAVSRDTIRAMDEKNIDLRDHFPKSLRHLSRSTFDIVIDMSGFELPDMGNAQVRRWEIADPVAMHYEDHCKVRDRVETQVMNLVLELRREAGLLRRSGNARERAVFSRTQHAPGS